MDFYEEIARLSAAGHRFVVATVVESKGSTPQKPGSKMVILPDGSIRGTVGGGAIERQIIDAALELFKADESTSLIETHLTHDLGMCCGGKMRVFLERHQGPARLWIFGAGHVGKALAQLAKQVGFWVCVVDERSDWASPGRLGFVDEISTRSPLDIARQLKGGPDSFFCVTTHDHALDQEILEILLPLPSAYLGVIGSKRKAERFRQRLTAAGFTADQLERLRCPMGVSIDALTPEEIAVSIVGELISVRRKPKLQSLQPVA